MKIMVKKSSPAAPFKVSPVQRKLKGVLWVLILSLALISACGGEYKLKVEGMDGETTSGEESGSNSSTDECDGTSETSYADSCDDDDTAGSGGSGAAQSGDDDSTDGGVEYLEPAGGGGGNRFFMGTYSYQQYGYYPGLWYDCDYGLPLTVRAYSHNDSIDFETTSGQLAWIATIFEDETFDFDVGFKNKFGNPSLQLACTCYLEESEYYSDEIKCACDPSNDDDACHVVYEEMEAM